MTRAELIISEEYLSAHIKLIVSAKKPFAKIREELATWIKKYRDEYATELILADRKDAAESATAYKEPDLRGGEWVFVDKDSILNRPLPEQLTK